MLLMSAMAYPRHLTQVIGGGGIPAPVGAFATNATATVTIPAPPALRSTHLLAVMCGYSAAGAVASALTGIPGQAAITVNGVTDQGLEIPGPFTTASYTISLAAGGSGVIGFVIAYYEFTP
jgi:hypothetical protein